jgi:hypothetical protein
MPDDPVLRDSGGLVDGPRLEFGGCYTDRSALDALTTWVRRLRADGRIHPDVHLSVDHDAGTAVGVLFDPTDPVHHWAVLRPGGFLVRLGRTLAVLPEIRDGHPAAPPVPIRAPTDPATSVVVRLRVATARHD